MVSYGFLYVLFKRCISLLTLVMMLIVCPTESKIPVPDGMLQLDKSYYFFEDRYMSNQGITNDGEYFYFSGKKNLGKAKIENGKIFLVMTNAIPDELAEKGCNHIGGLSYYDGKIYAAIEDGPDYQHPFIALYDAETLKYTGVSYELPQNLHTEGVPWCAIDAKSGLLYTAEWTKATKLNVFDVKTMKFIKTVDLTREIDQVQGGEIFNGMLYLSADDKQDEKTIFKVNPATGNVEEFLVRNIGVEREAEDMTVYAGANGNPVFCVVDRTPDNRATVLTRYISDTTK